MTTLYNHQLLGSEGATLFKRLTLGDKGGCNPVISPSLSPEAKGWSQSTVQSGWTLRTIFVLHQPTELSALTTFYRTGSLRSDCQLFVDVSIFVSFKTTFPESDDVGSLSVCP